MINQRILDIRFLGYKVGQGCPKQKTFAKISKFHPHESDYEYWPIQSAQTNKLSLGLAIGLRLRLLIVRQSQTIKLVPDKKLWQWWCTAQSRVYNGVHSMCATTATCWLCNSVQSVFRAFRMDGCQICHFMKNNSQRYIEQCTMVWLRANCQHSAGHGKNCIPFKNL